jgi:hypothetical protein
MSKNTSRLDALIAELAPVRDDELVAPVSSGRAATLFATIVEAPLDSAAEGHTPRRRRRVIAFAVTAVSAAVLSIPAFGVGPEIVSFFAGWRSEPDYPAPQPTASDIVIASGKHGVAWKLVATGSDQGLCLGLVYQSSAEEEVVDGSCGYVDLRGDLGPEFRGDPSTKCLTSPTTVVPCGSLSRRWIDFPRRTDGARWNRMILFGAAAADVARVDLVLTNGKTVSAHVVEQPVALGAPLNIYWIALPLEDGYRHSFEVVEPLEMVVARDADGRVLERRVGAWNGNPTGDPDGPPRPSLDGA